jgi:chromosome partitioning protein
MPSKVITVFNQKGGCGKTTIAMSLAGAIGLRGYSALVVDMDPQGTASRWASAAPEELPFPASVMSLAPMEGKMHRELRNHVDKYDVIFIDCPPAMSSAAPTSAMLVSDLTLIPVVPSPADIWAAESAKKLADAAKANNDTLVARVVANMVQRSTSIAKELMELLAEDQEFPLLKASLGSRAAFREAQILGSTVHRVPRATAAIEEVEAMVDEVLAILALPKLKKSRVQK